MAKRSNAARKRERSVARSPAFGVPTDFLLRKKRNSEGVTAQAHLPVLRAEEVHQLLHCQKCLCHVEPAEKAVCAVAAGMLSVFVGGHDASGSPPAIVGPNGVRPGASAAGTYTITQRATGILPVPSHGQDGHATIPRGCSAALRYPLGGPRFPDAREGHSMGRALQAPSDCNGYARFRRKARTAGSTA